MAKIISFSIFKGGTGKTTSAVNAAAALAERGKRVLLVDVDQQANSTRYVGIDPDDMTVGFHNVFMKQTTIEMVKQATPFGFDIVPSSAFMAAIDDSMEKGDELMLREILAPLSTVYDFILIDPPPGKGMLAFNAILAADLLLPAAKAEMMSIDGVSDLINHIQRNFWNRFTEQLESQEIRILITMYRSTTKHAPSVVHAARKIYRDNVLEFFVPMTVDFPRSYAERLPITKLSPTGLGAKSYFKLADWLIDYERA